MDPAKPLAPSQPLATEEDRRRSWKWGYCGNACIAALLRLGYALAHPHLANKCELLKRWWESAQLWLARDAEKRKVGMSAYLLALRDMKSALTRSDSNLRR